MVEPLLPKQNPALRGQPGSRVRLSSPAPTQHVIGEAATLAASLPLESVTVCFVSREPATDSEDHESCSLISTFLRLTTPKR